MPSPDPPPLAAWPAFAYKTEPAHGYFQRLAAANRVVSTRGFATDLGLNGRNLDMAQILSFCLQFPMTDGHNLTQATPTLTETHAYLAGQKFRKVRDWSVTQPRVCPGCILESPYHRTWFDLTSITECPFHGVPLVDGVDGERLNWAHPTVGELPSGACSVAACHPRIEPPFTWERYLLGRLGYISRWEIPFLDDVELCHVIDAADLLGFAATYGWSKRACFRRSYRNDQRRAAVRAGFGFIREGSAGIERCLTEYQKGAPIVPEPGRIRFSIYSYWGWVYDAARTLPNCKSTEAIRSSMDALALSRGVVSRKGPKSATALGFSTLYKLAPTLGLSVAALRTIATALGLTTKEIKKNDCHFFDEAAVKTVRNALADLVLRSEAVQILGGDPDEFVRLCEAGSVRPLVRMRGRGRDHDHFRRSELAQLTELKAMPPPKPG